ncbi:caspase-8-like [Denticeps clupeoides]|uniref:Caspase-8 n=1 Tax=Denticeps clupeoides TaxID=299321 RepID=A0AAY4AKU2_9TELE|nr:caspase-8-like [Denticeps clupeoides]
MAERNERDILIHRIQCLSKSDFKRFRLKLRELKDDQGNCPITNRLVDDKDEDDLADLLIETFKDAAVQKAIDVMTTISCNQTAQDLSSDNEKLKARKAERPTVSSDRRRDNSAHAYVDDGGSARDEYNMSSVPRGTCVIINNENFLDGSTRLGSGKDADDLKRVFHKFGFEVKRHDDQTRMQMEQIMKHYCNSATGDCFVCCILSHGGKKGVLGCDRKHMSISDIIDPFSGQNLAGRPKAFFIQACRGPKTQNAAIVEEDSSDEESDTETYDLLKTIPSHADLLIAMSTFEDHKSRRNFSEGSWFIQALCKELEDSCPNGEDILTVLTKVNKAVAGREGRSGFKQIPEPRFTLTKKLIFRAPEPGLALTNLKF